MHKSLTTVTIGPPMSAKRSKHRRSARQPSEALPPESRFAETLTIAWTVSVTGVLIADLMVLGASLFASNYPGVHAWGSLVVILLLLSAGMGTVSLGLLILAWRKRRLKPPVGFTAFAFCVAAAPMAALAVRVIAG
jgi:hypothetical protein